MRVLIVGNGRMGRFHTKTVRNAGDEVFTLDPYAPADIRFWDEAPQVDAAIIACPIDDLHVNALHAANKGLRVLVEKPAGATLEQVEHLHSIDPTMAVGYLERGNPVVAALAATVRDRYAPITFKRRGPRTTTNIELDVTSHDIDLYHRYFATRQATFIAARAITPQRTISIGGYTADLITRTLHHLDGSQIVIRPDIDLLGHQWRKFKAYQPLATIEDAIRVHETLQDRRYAKAA